jgi:DNA-binding transcriptional regulator YiaG
MKSATQVKKSENFPERIKAARAMLGLDQPQASIKWGFAFSTLSAWERGTRNPQGLYKEKLEKILSRLGV